MKKQGTLYVVATPIGNLDDITVRALNTLRSADLIACEDTRKSRVLLDHWGIKGRLLSLHKFSESRRIATLLDHLGQGLDIALISDAGTPAVSDPGSLLVRSASDAGFVVSPVPGPSSVIAAMSVSGCDGPGFAYLGFAPRKDKQREGFFRDMLSLDMPAVFFETPSRIIATLRVAAQVLGATKMVLLRELTKLHEERLCGDAASLLAQLEARASVKGEIAIVVHTTPLPASEPDPESIVRSLMEQGLAGKTLADEACNRFGINRRTAYQTYLKIRTCLE